ncbi:MAG: DUF1836 domain-containing protein [Bacillota bacterium]|nr:DUF1836 domain-containing protein [Bacillota bacterium]
MNLYKAPCSILNWDDLPRIDLYLDQLLTLTEEQLEPLNTTGERLLTSSMINNYVKQKLLPPPVKKRYTRDQHSRLVIIATLKNVLSISEIQFLLERLDEIPGMTPEKLHRRFLIGIEVAFSRISAATWEPSEESPTRPAIHVELLDDDPQVGTDADMLEAFDLAITAWACRLAALRRLTGCSLPAGKAGKAGKD